jgi:hypothetical protein
MNGDSYRRRQARSRRRKAKAEPQAAEEAIDPQPG